MATDNLPECRECSRPSCACHPEAFHKHYRSGSGWREYRGHHHDMIAPQGFGRGHRAYCTHDGCNYTTATSDIPVTIIRR